MNVEKNTNNINLNKKIRTIQSTVPWKKYNTNGNFFNNNGYLSSYHYQTNKLGNFSVNRNIRCYKCENFGHNQYQCQMTTNEIKRNTPSGSQGKLNASKDTLVGSEENLNNKKTNFLDLSEIKKDNKYIETEKIK